MSRVQINSKAYINLKEQIQEAFDFVYIVCQSVPCMKLQCNLVQRGQITGLPNPDYFGKANPVEQIREQALNYKKG